jgi:hypothetical protein
MDAYGAHGAHGAPGATAGVRAIPCELTPGHSLQGVRSPRATCGSCTCLSWLQLLAAGERRLPVSPAGYWERRVAANHEIGLAS